MHSSGGELRITPAGCAPLAATAMRRTSGGADATWLAPTGPVRPLIADGSVLPRAMAEALRAAEALLESALLVMMLRSRALVGLPVNWS